MPKSYFNDDEKLSWSPRANDVSAEIEDFLRIIYVRERAAGFSYRELSNIAHSAVLMAECQEALGFQPKAEESK